MNYILLNIQFKMDGITILIEKLKKDITLFSRFILLKNFVDQHCNDDVNNMLEEMRWDKETGFEKEPDEKYLIERLEKIVEKYTVRIKDVNYVTFSELIVKAIDDVENGKYNSKTSLVALVEQLDNLPISERELHGNHIDRIKNSIRGYNNKFDLLTKNQIKSLIFILEGRTGKKKKLHKNFFSASPSPAGRTANIDIDNFAYNIGHYGGIDVCTDERTIKFTKFHHKFDADDIITEPTLVLLSKITSNMMSSGITMCLLEYLELLQITLEDELHQKFYDEIMTMLEKEGWGKNGGFQREPKRDSIAMALNDLIMKYIEI